MTFTENTKLKALAIVHVFETSRAFGDYAACVVLDDGAGISYGINQFTHRSGSLAAVVAKYLGIGGVVGAGVLLQNLTALRNTAAPEIARLSANANLKKALRAAAVTHEMKAAQNEVAFERYLNPAIKLCEKYGFTSPLSLAVVYDSIVHGSFFRVARGVQVGYGNEREWIAAYIRRRDAWLKSFPRLAKTRYRTRFFLVQITISNWNLRSPLNVRGVKIADEIQTERLKADSRPDSVTEVIEKPGSSVAKQIEDAVGVATGKFDRVESVVSGVATRADSAKSMWTTIGGTLGQAAWAVFGFFAGLPREVWVTVAVIAFILALVYLYRQITLGKIREERAVYQRRRSREQLASIR